MARFSMPVGIICSLVTFWMFSCLFVFYFKTPVHTKSDLKFTNLERKYQETVQKVQRRERETSDLQFTVDTLKKDHLLEREKSALHFTNLKREHVATLKKVQRLERALTKSVAVEHMAEEPKVPLTFASVHDEAGLWDRDLTKLSQASLDSTRAAEYDAAFVAGARKFVLNEEMTPKPSLPSSYPNRSN